MCGAWKSSLNRVFSRIFFSCCFFVRLLLFGAIQFKYPFTYTRYSIGYAFDFLVALCFFLLLLFFLRHLFFYFKLLFFSLFFSFSFSFYFAGVSNSCSIRFIPPLHPLHRFKKFIVLHIFWYTTIFSTYKMNALAFFCHVYCRMIRCVRYQNRTNNS